MPRFLLLALLTLSGCASQRLLRIENRMLTEQNGELTREVLALRRVAPGPDRFVRDVDLQRIHELLLRAGVTHTLVADGGHIRIEHQGVNVNFSVTVQWFEGAGVVFLATKNYLHLNAAQNTESVVLLLVQMAAINYDMLLGKLQLNTRSGEILLSTEIHAAQGLDSDTLTEALDRLTQTADARYPELERAIAGVGL